MCFKDAYDKICACFNVERILISPYVLTYNNN